MEGAGLQGFICKAVARTLTFTPRWEPWKGFMSGNDIVDKGSLTKIKGGGITDFRYKRMTFLVIIIMMAQTGLIPPGGLRLITGTVRF